MDLYPHPVAEPIPIREALGKDSWINYRRGFGSGPVEWKRYGFDRPCLTIRKSTPQSSTTGLIHPYEIRHLTISEIKLMSSFPAGFRIEGKFIDKWARVGNSVPPLFMHTIAIYVQREILKRETHESLGTVCLPGQEGDRRNAC